MEERRKDFAEAADVAWVGGPDNSVTSGTQFAEYNAPAGAVTYDASSLGSSG